MSARIHRTWSQMPAHRALALVAVIALLGCSGDAPTTSPLPPASPPASLSISPTALSLIVGGKSLLVARAFDARGREASAPMVWSSGDAAIASVGRNDGIVTALTAGTTTVTASFGSLFATATVSVRPPDPPVGVVISTSGVHLVEGGIERLTARAYDSTGRATDVSFEWSSANPAVATIGRADGVVTGVSPGTTVITAAAGALRATATATVTVIAIADAFAFTRMSQPNPGVYTADVLSYSVADKTTWSLARGGQFPSIAAPTWTSDGKLMAVEVIRAFFSEEWMEYNSDVYVFDAAAPADAQWRALTSNGLSTSPVWSPDGKRIAYVQNPELFADRNDIYLVDVAGGAPVRLTSGRGYYGRPQWSPDGKRLAFSAVRDGGGHSEILVVNADGTGLTTVTPNTENEQEPTWSPDGTRLAFVRFRSESQNVYYFELSLANVDGSNVKRLTSMAGVYVGVPAWSPDGRHIIFRVGPSIYMINADGSDLIRVTTPPANAWDSAPVWRR